MFLNFSRVMALGLCLLVGQASADSACQADAASLLKLILADADDTPTGVLVVPVTDGLGRILVPAGSLARGTTPQRAPSGRIHFQWEHLDLPDGRKAQLLAAEPGLGVAVYDERGVLGLGAFAPGARALTYGARIQLPDC